VDLGQDRKVLASFFVKRKATPERCV
jgi:hypothetical protein